MPYTRTVHDGKIVAVRKLQHKSRIQVPIQIKNLLHLNEGEDVFWIKTEDNRVMIEKA